MAARQQPSSIDKLPDAFKEVIAGCALRAARSMKSSTT